MRRNLQPDMGVTGADFTRHFICVPYLFDDAEGFRVNEAIEELSALDSSDLVQYDHCHVLDVVIERITKRDHLDQRWEKHEEQGHRIAPDDDELLEQDGAEATERPF